VLVPRLLRTTLTVILSVACVACYAAPSSRNAVASQANSTEQNFLAALNSSQQWESGTMSDQSEKANEPPVYIVAASFILKLGLVLVLAYVTILGLKRFSLLRGSSLCGSQRIKVIENSPLGASKMLHLVEIGPKRLLLASTQSQVSLLAELRPEDLPEISAPAGVGGFKDQLAMFLGATPGTDATESNIAQMLRESAACLQDKVKDVGKLRRKLKDDTDE